MNEDSCRLPVGSADGESEAVRRMVDANRIAVVGLSDDPSRASYEVAAYLRSVGKQIIPVNPKYATVMGLRCYPSLAAVPGPIEVVDVFRRSEFCAGIAREAVEAGAKGLWLQSGVTSDEARIIAWKAGIDYVENRCLKVEHLYRER